MMRTLRTTPLAITLACALLGGRSVAHAQSPDDGFNPDANNTVRALAVQPDGKILAGGSFTTLGGQERNYLGRLNPDGSLNESSNPGANNQVWALAVQSDGKVVVGGIFTSLGGQGRSRIARLDADGQLDEDFNPGASSFVAALTVSVTSARRSSISAPRPKSTRAIVRFNSHLTNRGSMGSSSFTAMASTRAGFNLFGFAS